MRTYFEPEMKIAVFDVINCAISSGNVEGNFTQSQEATAFYGKGNLGEVMSKDSIQANMN